MIEKLLASAASRVVLMDGGMGSSVEDRGVPVRSALCYRARIRSITSAEL